MKTRVATARSCLRLRVASARGSEEGAWLQNGSRSD